VKEECGAKHAPPLVSAIEAACWLGHVELLQEFLILRENLEQSSAPGIAAGALHQKKV
jgi:hypothetical protein